MIQKLSEIIHPSVQAKIARWWRVFMFFVSFVTIGAIVIDYGFDLIPTEMTVIYSIYGYAWWIFLFSYIVDFVFQWASIRRKTIVMTLILGVLLLLSALPKFIVAPAEPWMQSTWSVLSSKYFVLTVLSVFAAMGVSNGVISFINKRTNPALLMAASFAVIIAFGALLLLLPRSTQEHIQLPVVDALFVSTSAVCVTGLTTVDVASTFTLEGQIVIALLIQIGGLGVMTITSFFALFFMGGTGLYNQFTLRDMVGSDTFSSLISTLVYILGFTFVIEAIGALCIWLNIHSTMDMTLHEEIFFSIFHAVSAFCNAGFSTLSDNLGNSAIISGHNGFFIVISILIIFGGIGFPILVNFKKILFYHLGHLFSRLRKGSPARPRFIHLADINTKIVLSMTAILIVGGTIVFAVAEWNGSLASMPVADKITHALFNSAATRTAGFNSVDLSQFSTIAIIFYIFLMWIGGASQSTAGGIKVNTFAVVFANFIAAVKGHRHVVMFNREISSDSIRRASAVVFGSILTLLFFFVLLVILEPELPAKGLLFETVSAFSTVGSSLNISPQLGVDSKIVVSLLMFIGRVGLLTILVSVVRQAGSRPYRYPTDNVIIN